MTEQSGAPRRRARTREEKQRRSDGILRSARDLFFSRGYHETTIEMITAGAGVSTGTFYVYYRNKIEIFKALQNEGLDILLELIEEVISRPGESARARMAGLAQAYLRYYRDYREYFEILAIVSATPRELKETDSELSRIIDDKTHDLLKLIEGVLREGVEAGEFVGIDTWKATTVFWGLMDGLILLEERNNIENVIGLTLEELVSQALEMSFHGIMKSN
jgi:AcrR family transcriptional regulator